MNPWNLITMVTLLFVSKSADHLRKKKEGNLKNIEVNCTFYASLLFFLAVLSSTCCQSPFWRTEQIQVLLIAWTLIMWKLQEELPFSHLSGRTELSPVWNWMAVLCVQPERNLVSMPKLIRCWCVIFLDDRTWTMQDWNWAGDPFTHYCSRPPWQDFSSAEILWLFQASTSRPGFPSISAATCCQICDLFTLVLERMGTELNPFLTKLIQAPSL